MVNTSALSFQVLSVLTWHSYVLAFMEKDVRECVLLGVIQSAHKVSEREAVLVNSTAFHTEHFC